MLSFLNIFYTIAHLLLITFILFGWVWKKTRKAHFIAVVITALSWFVLGIWYGWGYCPLTDWHWDVKDKLGESNLPNSFIKYFADKITREDISTSILDGLTLGCLVLAIIVSVYVNFFLNARKINTKDYGH